jgi:hypothetical protein
MSIEPESPAAPPVLWHNRCSIPTPLGIAAQLGWNADELANDGIVARSRAGSPRTQIGMTEVHP